jgi:hypothetical protein
MKTKKVMTRLSLMGRLKNLNQRLYLLYRRLFSKRQPKQNLNEQVTDHNWWEWV